VLKQKHVSYTHPLAHLFWRARILRYFNISRLKTFSWRVTNESIYSYSLASTILCKTMLN